MGFFKDLGRLQAQSKEMDRTFDPAAQARAGTAKMAAMTEMLNQQTAALTAPPADSVDCRATVVTVGLANGMLNGNPLVPVDLLVEEPGLPPRPLSTTLVVPTTQLQRITAGTSLPLKVSASDPSAVVVDWSVPA